MTPKERTVARMVEEAKRKSRKARPARLDKEGTAKPRTKIVGHFREGVCVGPGSTPESYEVRDVSPNGGDGDGSAKPVREARDVRGS